MTTIATNSTITYSAENGIMRNGVKVTAWPITITSNVTVIFGSNLILTANNQYFILNGSNIIIDGLYNNVIVENVVNFPGLINGTFVATISATIKNFGIISTGTTTLQSNRAWIVYFNYNTATITLSNCYSTGNMTNNYTAGIIYANGPSGTIYCNNCYSIGDMNGQYSAGIMSGGFVCYATNCYSTGNMNGQYSGGIMSGIGGGAGSATNCYSTGNMTSNCGGIYGPGSSGNAINCHSSGSIASASGGIYGYSGRGNATGCYSTGTNSGDFQGGGIYAYGCSGNATNCYVAGVNTNSNDIASTNGYTGIIKNCYSLTRYYP